METTIETPDDAMVIEALPEIELELVMPDEPAVVLDSAELLENVGRLQRENHSLKWAGVALAAVMALAVLVTTWLRPQSAPAVKPQDAPQQLSTRITQLEAMNRKLHGVIGEAQKQLDEVSVEKQKLDHLFAQSQ